MLRAVYGNEVKSEEVMCVFQVEVLGDRGLIGSEVLPPAGSPSGSSSGKSERSCSFSGSEDLPLHPPRLSAPHHPGVQVQTKTHSDGFNMYCLRHFKLDG